MNEVINCIIKRRSVRKFKKDQVPDRELEAILEAGRYAPSGGNNQYSHLLVVQNISILEQLKKLVEQELSKMEVYDGMYKSLKGSVLAAKKGGYDFCYHAPTLVIVANKKGYGNAMADSACLLENMMLAAASIDIGSCWINQLHWLDDNAEIRSFLGKYGLLEEDTISGALALGWKEEEDKEPLQRTGNRVTYIR